MHDMVVAEIMARAAGRGILAHYCGRSQLCRGARGLPDLVLVGQHRAAFIEVKMGRDQLEPEQTTWKHSLCAAGELYYQVGGASLDNGVVDRILQYLATGKSSM